MATINGVGVNGSATNNNINSQNSKKQIQGDDAKKTLTAPKVVLGSLATIGVLGMADVLLCRGKHINKLTGKTKEFEETVTKLEEKLTKSESRCSESETKCSELEKDIQNAQKLAQYGNDKWAITYQRVWFDGQNMVEQGNIEMGEAIKKRARGAVHSRGYQLEEREALLKNPEMFEVEATDNIDKIQIVTPAVVHRKDGRVVEHGIVHLPYSVEEKLGKMSEEEQQALLNNPEMWV